MSPSLAKTIAMFVQRRASMPPLKREEMASFLAEPLIERFKMMPDTSRDLLLCSLFYRDFVMDGKT